jgi:hypothetical protein
VALYTVSGVLDKAKVLLEEAVDVNIVTEDQLIGLVNESQKWVAAESGCYQAWDTITLARNTVRYSAPANTSVVLALQYDYGGDIGVRNLLRIEPEAIPGAPNANLPYYWHYRGNYVSIYPKIAFLPPTTSVDILTANVPANLTALTDSLVIPDQFQIVVPYHVAKTVAIKDNQFTKAQQLEADIQRYTREGIAQYGNLGTVGTSGPGGTSGGAS